MITLTPWTIGSEHDHDDCGHPTTYQDDVTGWPYFVREPRGAEHPHGLGYGGLHVACGVQNLDDARLIAAAPKLLEALKAISEIADPSSGDRGPTKYARHIAKCAIAAIGLAD